MTRYRMYRFIGSASAGLLLLGAIAAALFIPVWQAVAAFIVGLVLLGFILPSSRAEARRCLGQGICPNCREPVRHTPGGGVEYYCRHCTHGFTERGKDVRERESERMIE